MWTNRIIHYFDVNGKLESYTLIGEGFKNDSLTAAMLAQAEKSAWRAKDYTERRYNIKAPDYPMLSQSLDAEKW